MIQILVHRKNSLSLATAAVFLLIAGFLSNPAFGSLTFSGNSSQWLSLNSQVSLASEPSIEGILAAYQENNGDLVALGNRVLDRVSYNGADIIVDPQNEARIMSSFIIAAIHSGQLSLDELRALMSPVLPSEEFNIACGPQCN